MSGISEFRTFVMRGNVVDLAVGVIVGAAFGKIVDSMVRDLLMPLIGLFVGGIDFSNWFFMLGKPPASFTGPLTYEALSKAGVPLFAYGNFMTVVINFIILAFVIFMMVRQINRLAAIKEKAAEAPPAPAAAPPVSEEVLLLREIRDTLARGQAAKG
jgi:large conductance mechanosensitive channel